MSTWHLDIKLIRAAAECAPSVFNQRPWEVRPLANDPDRAELWAVPSPEFDTRLLREAVISCGAALYNMRLAIRAAGHTPSVWVVPGLNKATLVNGLPAGPVLLASVEEMAGRPTPATGGVEELYEAMWLRRTDRWPYDILPVPLPLLVEMEDAAAEEHGWLRVLHPGQEKRILRAAARASDRLAGNPAYAASLRRMNRVPIRNDGPRPENTKDPPTRPELWLPDRTERFERRPQLMALSTDDDRPLDWLRAGQALQHALLTGTRYSMSAPAGRSARYRVSLKYAMSDWHPLRQPPHVPDEYGMTASFLTQSLELDDLRRQARRWPWNWLYREVPQMVLRVGFAPMVRVAPPSGPEGFPETRIVSQDGTPD